MLLTMKAVVIRGGGGGANGGARLLGARGFRVDIENAPRPKLPAIMIGGTTQRLFQEVFGQEGLFLGLPGITKRVVAWGSDSKPRALAHAAVVVPEQSLLERLGPQAPIEDKLERGEPAWTVITSSQRPATLVEDHFAPRMHAAAPVA